MKHVFLSPHLDDGIASCGGLIAKLIFQREEVTVTTVYTKSPNITKLPKNLHKFAIYDQRKKEDLAALDKLSANHKWLELTERAYREPIPKRPTEVFKIDLSKGLEQFTNITPIWEELDKIFEDNPKTHIYASLGIGNHYDHVEVFLAALTYMVDYNLNEQFSFYLDFYGVLSTRIRKKHYLGNFFLKNGIKKPENSSLRYFMMTSVINTMISGNNIDQMLDDHYLNLKWTLKKENIQGYEKLKFSALESYQSQVKLFGLEKGIKAIQTHHNNWDYSELYLKTSLV